MMSKVYVGLYLLFA